MTAAGPPCGGDWRRRNSPSGPRNEFVSTQSRGGRCELQRKRRVYRAYLFGVASRNRFRPQKCPTFSPQDRPCECKFARPCPLLQAPKGKAIRRQRECTTPRNSTPRGKRHQENRTVAVPLSVC